MSNEIPVVSKEGRSQLEPYGLKISRLGGNEGSLLFPNCIELHFGTERQFH